MQEQFQQQSLNLFAQYFQGVLGLQQQTLQGQSGGSSQINSVAGSQDIFSVFQRPQFGA